MKKVTEQQFKNFRKAIYRRFDHVFLRLDQQDDKIGELYAKMDLVNDKMHLINENLERRNRLMDQQVEELKAMNVKMDARIGALETWRNSYTS